MNTIELKTDLFRLIDEIEDISVLYAIRILLAKQKKQNITNDFWDELPENLQKEIDAGIEEANRKEFLPHQEVMAKIKNKYLSV